MTTLLEHVAGRDNRAFDFSDNKCWKSALHSFSWTVGEALDATIWGFYRIMKVWIDDIDTNTILRTVLNNARIFRGIALQKWIESKKWWYSLDYVSVLEDYVKCSWELTDLSVGFLDSITSFSLRLWSILDLEISQRPDAESWVAMDPRFSQFSADVINKYLWREDYVFITFWNGWIVPWFEVFSKLKCLTWERWKFYPVRFSRIKSKDNIPQITLSEKRVIEVWVQWKQIILFDEDSSSWNTLLKAEEFFQNQFPENTWIFKRSNIGIHGYVR